MSPERRALRGHDAQHGRKDAVAEAQRLFAHSFLLSRSVLKIHTLLLRRGCVLTKYGRFSSTSSLGLSSRRGQASLSSTLSLWQISGFARAKSVPSADALLVVSVPAPMNRPASSRSDALLSFAP